MFKMSYYMPVKIRFCVQFKYCTKIHVFMSYVAIA